MAPRPFLALLLLLTACRQAPAPAESAGRLEVSWDGSPDGALSAPAAADWCGRRQVLEIRALKGDTGVALALYPGKALTPGAYPVVDPARAESIPPAAGVAVRWLAKNLVQGFRSDSGRVTLERSGPGRFSGRVMARARSVVDTQRITLEGTFRDLVVRRDTVGCEADDVPSVQAAETADIGVH
jgi:hypothetical protein